MRFGLGWSRLVELNERSHLSPWYYWSGVVLGGLGKFLNFGQGEFESLKRHHFKALFTQGFFCALIQVCLLLYGIG